MRNDAPGRAPPRGEAPRAGRACEEPVPAGPSPIARYIRAMRPPSPADEERYRHRGALLALANDALGDAVEAASKEHPLLEIAALIVGDARNAREVLAGHRLAIADRVKSMSKDPGVAPLAKLLVAQRERGFVPCVFFLTLPGGAVDVSVVMLRMEGVS